MFTIINWVYYWFICWIYYILFWTKKYNWKYYYEKSLQRTESISPKLKFNTKNSYDIALEDGDKYFKQDKFKEAKRALEILGVEHEVIFDNVVVKEGEAFLIPSPSKRVLRVGASDITFRRPGMQDRIFLEVPDVAGLELRAFCDQGVIITVPAQCTKYTGITD